MMPGETPPAANTTAIAAEAATACANCGALQQNLNEYVAALIALKQKIIDADHLLAEYQQKCSELQFAKRENSTLHHQVEQMFQKISPLKKCQEELGSVKAELEEKKSSLKIYQETHLEYVRVKEEMDKSDSVKKKLETKVKKLEEAAAKHTQKFKQLKAEKKVLERELKKAQEKIDGFPNRKQKKVLKNAETQSESENLVANLDKEKIKLLLEELWQCIESSTGKKQINKCEPVLETRRKTKTVQNPEKMKKSERAWISNCSPEPSTRRTSPTSLKIKLNKKSAGNSCLIENTFMETTEANNSGSAFDEDRCLEVVTEADCATNNMDLFNKEQEEFGESLRDVLKWIRPLPPLLSPIQFSPAATPDNLFGDITDSSDDEMEQNAQTLENIIEECEEDKPASKALHLTEFCSHILNNNSIKTDPQEPHERSKKLENEESVLLSDFMFTTSKYLNESNTKPNNEENSDFKQIHTAPEVISPSIEKLSEKVINMTETKDQIFTEHVLEETNDFIQKEEKKKLTETKEDIWGQSPKGGEQQETKEPILTAENTPVPSKNVKDPSSNKQERVLESISEDLQPESYSEKARFLCEKHTEHIMVNEQNTATGNSEPLIEEKKNVSNCKFLPETNYFYEEVQKPGARITFTESIEKNVNSLEASLEPHSVEEICSEQNGNKINGKNELVDVLRSNSDVATLTGGLKQSSYHGGEIIEAMNLRPTKNVADGTTEGMKLEDIQKEEFLQLEQLLDEKRSIKSPQEQSTYTSDTNKLPTPASIAEDSWLKSEGLIEASHESLELENVTENAPQLGQVEKADIKPKNMSKVEGIWNSLNSYMEEDLQPLRKTLTEINCESGKLTEVGTIQSLTAGLSGKTCIKTIYNIDSPSLIHGPSQIEKNSTMIINELSDTKKSAMEGKGMNYDCSASNEVASVQNRSKDTVQPTQNVSQGENEEIESGLSVAMTDDSEANMESLNVTASNFEVKVDFFSRNSQNVDAANPPSSIPKCIASSSPNKENADHVDQHNSEENWNNEKSKTEASEGDKLLNLREINWNYHNPFNKKDEMDIEEDKNDFSKPQASVTTKSCSRGNSEMLSSEASSPKNINSIDTCVENKLPLSHEELLIPGDKNLDMLSGNYTVEYIDEKTAKEANTILSTEIRSRGIDEINMLENSVAVMNSSVSNSSKEFYPLRKVNCTKTHPVCAVSRDTSCSIKNSEASLLTSMSSSDGARHEMSPMVTGEECLKDRKAEEGDTGSSVNKVIEKTCEHLYAAAWPCTNENTTLKVEASSAIEKLEEKQSEKNVSIVTLLPSQDLNKKKTISGKSPVSDPDANDDMVALHTKYPSDEQVHCDLLIEKLNVEQTSISTSESSSGLGQSCITVSHTDDGTDISHNKRYDVNNDEQSIASKTTWTSVSPISKSSSSNNKQQKVLSEKLEPLLAFAKNGAEETFNSSDSVMIKTQAEVNDGDDSHLQNLSICKRKRKNQPRQLAETILANADTSTPAKFYPKTLTKIMQEMGPPLPPLLPPLKATPPRTVQPISPVVSFSSQSSLPSPLDELISPLHKTPVPPLTSTLSETPKRKSSSSSAFTTLSPTEMSVRQRILSSPLQFCSTTPKHALPVPGRLPSSTAGNSVPSVPQENSVKILDSMYPELSARARTLSILKGNIQFSRSSSVDEKGIHQISGFKAIASTSTAFVKTGIRFKSDPEKLLSSVHETGKRKLPSVTMTKSVKRPRLDSKSSTLNLCKEKLSDGEIQCSPDGDCLDSGDAIKSAGDCNSELLEMEKTEDPDSWAVTVALEKISEACFDLLPVIRSRVLVGNTSKVPIMRDEEKEVVYQLGVEKKSLAEPALQAILNKLKKQKMSLGHNHIQALCRVYVGICCQLGDLEKARLFCYTLLKEDFPRSDQLILFITNIWSEVFSSDSVINKAVQLVARQRAKGDVLKCLKTYLNWEENAPVDISMMISSLLWAIQLCPQMEFQLSEKYGEDLKENTWQYVFAIDLLCSYQKWCWTHDNIISKELWPIMDNWIKSRNGNGSISSSSDIIIATVLRLIGRLGQIGLREGFFPAVENISSVIGVFLQHAKEKDVPWGVQLAAAYALFDLGPSNPSRILEAIHAWKAVHTNSLPPAVLNGIAEVSSLLTCTGRTEDCSLA